MMGKLLNSDVTRRGAMTLALVAVVISGMTVLSPLAGSAPQDEEDTRQVTSAAYREWAQVQRKLEAERHDWALSKVFLADRIELLDIQLEREETSIAEVEKSLASTDETLAEKSTVREEYEEALALLEERIVELEERTKTILKRLPDSLKQKVKVLSDRFPSEEKKEGEKEVKLKTRFQTVVGILNSANKFNREILVLPETRKLSDGREVSVETMYVGLGQAWYATDDGLAAGHGLPTDEGWVFTPVVSPSERSEIVRAIGMFKRLENPDFARIPVRVQ